MNVLEFAQRLGVCKIGELENGVDILVRIHKVLNVNKRLRNYLILFDGQTTGEDIVRGYSNYPDFLRDALAKVTFGESDLNEDSMVTKPWFKEFTVGGLAIVLMFLVFFMFLFFQAFNAKYHLGYESSEVISWFLKFGSLVLQVLHLQ